MRGWIVLGGVLLLAAPARAAYWYEDFDGYPAGPLEAQPGWICNSPGVAVVSGNADSEPHALYLPPTHLAVRYAVYQHVEMSGGNILRIAFRLKRQNADQFFYLGLRSNTVSQLYISTDAADSSIKVNEYDTGVVFPSGAYARFTLFYNQTTDEVALDLDGSRILNWQDIGVASFSRIDNILFQRISGTSDSGGMYVDDVSVQTIPDAVRAWWRFEEGAGLVACEETGRFMPDTYVTQPGGGWLTTPTALQTLFNGTNAVRNRHASDSRNINAIDQAANIDLGTDWTLEWMASITDVKGVCIFFEWTTYFPPQTTTGAWIQVGYEKNDHRIFAYLRDDAGPGDVDFYFLGEEQIPSDSRWHHFALTKEGNQLECFLDYRSVGTRSLFSDSDGSYSFDADCTAYIGQSSSNAWFADLGIRMDEVRVSDEVFLPGFLQIDHPEFSLIEPGAETTDLTFFGPPWVSFSIRSCANIPSSGLWPITNGFSYLAGTNFLGEEKTVTVDHPSTAKGFFKIQ